MILLISPEQTNDTEIQTLHQLFEAGLEYFHFRKPGATLEEHRVYLDKVNPKYYQYIMTHNFPQELTQEYAIKGIHLEERKWRAQEEQLETYVTSFTDKGFAVSSSYHEPEDLAAQKVEFAYHLLSPVFAAISKSDMQGRGFDVREIPKFIAGMGGINASTTPEAVKLGFQGVGALGGVWNADDPVEAFKEMQSAFAKSSLRDSRPEGE
ncbi:thiamine phosphate synthase [uncultured Dokdonia sp.]|uniref:thiamine phosphate synthase n=1 Tax=uncultured Dokdonia sp. TaxID=575653 RepID=UPI002638EC0C|nr:thiamine phosphate synthase [uncultured Dokdonia sp.]